MIWIAPSEKDTDSAALEKRLWDSADQFRANSGLKAQEYSGPILGIIFLRFAEVRFTAQRAKLESPSPVASRHPLPSDGRGAGGEGAARVSRRGSRVDEPAAYHAESILYLAPNARFDFLLNLPEAKDIGELLDESIAGIAIREEGPPPLDLSRIDFEVLAKRFKESKRKNTDLEVLKAAIRAHLEKLIRLNKTRADFADRFEELIDSYNAGSRNIEELFEELVKLSRSLSDEQQRHVREKMTEEELVIFDILTRPAPEMSPDERSEVKKVARELLGRLKSLLVLNWRQKSSARSQLKLVIEDVLDSGLPRIYDKPLYEQKCFALFEHVYENYPERDAGTYATAH